MTTQWEVEVTDQFLEWWTALSISQQESVDAAIPAADALYDDHLEELRDEGLI